jgi:hypothetical protein
MWRAAAMPTTSPQLLMSQSIVNKVKPGTI